MLGLGVSFNGRPGWWFLCVSTVGPVKRCPLVGWLGGSLVGGFEAITPKKNGTGGGCG